ncbi:hypothetical protein R1flu_009102 [Riccia fluitans]|uniref:Uncharacterized protein n=1 Tax=Riccia fluitans TaxID=41844 RepID=A0ABD1Z1C3_9MARC
MIATPESSHPSTRNSWSQKHLQCGDCLVSSLLLCLSTRNVAKFGFSDAGEQSCTSDVVKLTVQNPALRDRPNI